PSSSYRSPSSSKYAAIAPLDRSGTPLGYGAAMQTGTAWLILPTYDEAENIERIVRAVLPVLERSRCRDHRILVVDDGSPDGTGAIADRLAAELPQVEVLHRERPT